MAAASDAKVPGWPLRLAALPLMLLVGFLAFPASGHDDTHITYWVAQALLRFHHIVNYDGEPVEQSSSLLFVLLLAAVRRLTGLSLPTVGPLLSITFGLLVIEQSGRLTRQLNPRLDLPVRIAVALNANVAYWSFSGTESTCAAFLTLGLIRALVGISSAPPSLAGFARTSAWTAGLLLVRPETPLVLPATLLLLAAVFALSGHRGLSRRLLVVLGLAIVFDVALFAWREHSFGSLFPLPVTAKASHLGKHTLSYGIEYLFLDAGPVVLVLLAVLALDWVRAVRERSVGSPLRTLLLGFASMQIAFVLAVGGDWMLAGRFLVSTIPLATICAADLVPRQLASRRRALRWSGYAAFVALECFGVVSVARKHAAPLWAFSRLPPLPGYSFFETHHFDHRNFIRSLPDARAALELVRRKKGGPSVVLGNCAGVPVYYLASDYFGQFEFVDILGIATTHMSRCPLNAAAPHDALGIRITYDDYARRKKQLASQCGIPVADIIYDSFNRNRPAIASRERVLESTGYRIVARQPSETVPDAGVLVAVAVRYLAP